MNIDDLRHELERIDEEILQRVAERLRLARRIEQAKARGGLPIRDFRREREVVEQACRTAVGLELDPSLAQRLVEDLIRSSLSAQERQRVEAAGHGSGRDALVIGGAGRMGSWFTHFLDAQGFAVEIADPAVVECETGRRDWQVGRLDHDLILIATPLRVAAEILSEMADRRPPGVVLDIGSVKAPVRAALDQLASAGVDAASIHPLFGPDTELLSGRHVVVVDLGRPRATETAASLFASTMAEVVAMPLEEHDRLMAWVLGLSHAVNIVFAASLADSGMSIDRLARLASTTFGAQLAVASQVVGENPHLYFEIQQLNRQGHAVLSTVSGFLDQLREAVAAGDEAAFVTLMERAREHLAARR